jgi:hypothetical protein
MQPELDPVKPVTAVTGWYPTYSAIFHTVP